MENDDNSDVDEGGSFDEQEQDALERFINKRSQPKKRAGRKATWSPEVVDDLVDIICENEKYKEKLLLTNVKNVKNSEYYKKVIQEIEERCTERGETFPYDLKQTRDKFKRCVSACREAALKIKTSSGIKRFQEEKEYGQWFTKLYGVVKSFENCQPEQSIEPGSINNDEPPNSEEYPENCSSTSENSDGNKGKRKVFVPVHESSRKSKRTTERLQSSLLKIEEALANDPTKELVEFLREDAKRQEERENRFFSLMENVLMPQRNTVTQASVPPYQNFNGMHHTQPQVNHFTSLLQSPISDTSPLLHGHHQHRYGMTHSVLRADNIFHEQSE